MVPANSLTKYCGVNTCTNASMKTQNKSTKKLLVDAFCPPETLSRGSSRRTPRPLEPRPPDPQSPGAGGSGGRHQPPAVYWPPAHPILSL